MKCQTVLNRPGNVVAWAKQKPLAKLNDRILLSNYYGSNTTLTLSQKINFVAEKLLNVMTLPPYYLETELSNPVLFFNTTTSLHSLGMYLNQQSTKKPFKITLLDDKVQYTFNCENVKRRSRSMQRCPLLV